MKSERTAAGGDVQLHVILRRDAGEIARLSELTDRLQHTTFEVAATAGPEHFATYQELDRLHQNLTQLSRFVLGLSEAVPEHYIADAGGHAGQINITDLLNSLLGVAAGGDEDQEHGSDEFELFGPVHAEDELAQVVVSQ